MSKISVRLDSDLCEKAKSLAKKKGTSLSGYINSVLKADIDNRWPETS